MDWDEPIKGLDDCNIHKYLDGGFCPIIKEYCKEKECAWWSEEELPHRCAVIDISKFLACVADGLPGKLTDGSSMVTIMD